MNEKKYYVSEGKIFDLDHWTPDWDTPPAEQSVQATFWELQLPQVRKVRHFIAK